LGINRLDYPQESQNLGFDTIPKFELSDLIILNYRIRYFFAQILNANDSHSAFSFFFFFFDSAFLRRSAKVKCKSEGAPRQSAKVKCKSEVFAAPKCKSEVQKLSLPRQRRL
jgi:hypothetical protein